MMLHQPRLICRQHLGPLIFKEDTDSGTAWRLQTLLFENEVSTISPGFLISLCYGKMEAR
jgi:hypothetical protein